jgi:nicotinate-nucleotide pyrophosphorylase
MRTFKVNLDIEADSPEEVAEKLQAFQDLQDNLEHEDLVQAVEMIVENPEIVDFIKDVAPEDGEELSLTDYISIARKAFVRFA